MSELLSKCACVVDHGLFLPVAERLARDFERVLFFSPWETGFSTVNAAVIGDGMEHVERCNDIWKVKDEVDVWCFPDCQNSGLQLELESQGRAVWGSRAGDRLELDREYFMRTLAEAGLSVPKFEVVIGVTALRELLKEKEDCYIKISKFRGSLETKHWRSWKLDENLIDLWAVRFGAVRELIRFLVFDAIDTPLEIGCDTYNVRGKWPNTMLHGLEWKDKAYFSAVTKRDNMPEPVKAVLTAFEPILEQARYTNEFSMELRVTEDDFFFLDPTCRGGLPSTASQIELWENFSEIVWAGAHGELVEPETNGQFAAEIILTAKADKTMWATIEIPDELKQWCKLAGCCEVDGMKSWPNDPNDEDHHVGWLVAIGDTPAQTLERLKEYVDMLPKGLSTDIAPIDDIIREIETEEKAGITFTPKPIPAPASVLAEKS